MRPFRRPHRPLEARPHRPPNGSQCSCRALTVRSRREGSLLSSSSKTVIWSPAGASSRAFREFHGVVVGEPAPLDQRLPTGRLWRQRRQPKNVTPNPGATRRPTSTSSIVATCAGLGQLKSGSTCLKNHDVLAAFTYRSTSTGRAEHIQAERDRGSESSASSTSRTRRTWGVEAPSLNQSRSASKVKSKLGGCSCLVRMEGAGSPVALHLCCRTVLARCALVR
jgi:hypothetical protein